MRRLLLYEFLHADADAFAAADRGMLSEGRAMLQALLADAAGLFDVSTVVLLCRTAEQSLSVHVPTGCELSQCPHLSPLDALVALATDCDFVLPVAPECDGALLSVARALQPLACTTLLPPLSVVEICSDKLRTRDMFCSSSVPMIECGSVWRRSSGPRHSDSGTIYKPRRGAGCEGIQRGRLPLTADPQDYFSQPFVRGRSLSVGVLSGPAGYELLPVAEQSISWRGSRPKYDGGKIPADIPDQVRAQITAVAEQVLRQIDGFTGYLGIDFLLADADGKVFLNEINPRVCTSYVGYRQMLEFNQLAVMLGDAAVTPHRSSSRSIRFRADGAS